MVPEGREVLHSSYLKSEQIHVAQITHRASINRMYYSKRHTVLSRSSFKINSKLALTTLKELSASPSLSTLHSCTGLSLSTSCSQAPSPFVVYYVNQWSQIFPLCPLPGFSNPRTKSSASPRNLLDVQILGLHSRPPESETLRSRQPVF